MRRGCFERLGQRASVLDCGDGVCEVTALALARADGGPDLCARPGLIESGDGVCEVTALVSIVAGLQTPHLRLLTRSHPKAATAQTSSPHSKSWRHFFAALCLFVALFTQVSPLHAQPAAPNYVLSLGGTNGFLELPPNDLPNLTESE